MFIFNDSQWVFRRNIWVIVSTVDHVRISLSGNIASLNFIEIKESYGVFGFELALFLECSMSELSAMMQIYSYLLLISSLLRKFYWLILFLLLLLSLFLLDLFQLFNVADIHIVCITIHSMFFELPMIVMAMPVD